VSGIESTLPLETILYLVLHVKVCNAASRTLEIPAAELMKGVPANTQGQISSSLMKASASGNAITPYHVLCFGRPSHFRTRSCSLLVAFWEEEEGGFPRCRATIVYSDIMVASIACGSSFCDKLVKEEQISVCCSKPMA